ncbi:MAG: cytidylyltransferase domain-containing protein [Candidatus Kariarchaeaceae archaeon]|jgi:hypothetical protein
MDEVNSQSNIILTEELIKKHQISVMVLAGADPSDDSSLLKATGVRNKALIPIAGRPIVSYVLEAINGSQLISSIYLVGIKQEDLDLKITKPITFLPGVGKRIDNVFSTFEYLAELDDPPEHILSISSDVPLISPEIIDTTIVQMNIPLDMKDFYFSILEKDVMEAKFPNVNKRFSRLKEGIFCGGDISARKSMVKMILRVSPLFVFRFLLRRLSINHIVNFFKKQFNANITAYINNFAEAGMDLDYPDQLDRFEQLVLSKT